jgi:hypothetical protein
MPLLYQWRSNGTNIPGATNQVLTLGPADASMSGTYAVVVENHLGRAQSPEARVDVVDQQPFFMTQPAGGVVRLRDRIRLEAAVEGSGPLAYQWFFNGDELADGTNSVLAFDGITFANAGKYELRVTNLLGSATSAIAELNVLQIVVSSNAPPELSQKAIPTNLASVVQIAAGRLHCLALTEEGHVVGWGVSKGTVNLPNNLGQAVVPPGLSNVVAIAAGAYHSLALRQDGTVFAWGAGSNAMSYQPHYGQAKVPDGLKNVVAIGAGEYSSVALLRNGRVVTWGMVSRIYGQAILVPEAATNVISVVPAFDGLAMLRSDETLVRSYTINAQILPAKDVFALAGRDYTLREMQNTGSLLDATGSVGRKIADDIVQVAVGRVLPLVFEQWYSSPTSCGLELRALARWAF